jgi:ATP adenylyltransferase
MPNEEQNARETLQLEPGTLWDKAIAQTEQAKSCGALQFLPTEYEFIEQDGINFLVRVLPHLVRKDEAKRSKTKILPILEKTLIHSYLTRKTYLLLTFLIHICVC